eukprot:6182890-Pleurochrysis_carterae.AAC.4
MTDTCAPFSVHNLDLVLLRFGLPCTSSRISVRVYNCVRMRAMASVLALVTLRLPKKFAQYAQYAQRRARVSVLYVK